MAEAPSGVETSKKHLINFRICSKSSRTNTGTYNSNLDFKLISHSLLLNCQNLTLYLKAMQRSKGTATLMISIFYQKELYEP